MNMLKRKVVVLAVTCLVAGVSATALSTALAVEHTTIAQQICLVAKAQLAKIHNLVVLLGKRQDPNITPSQTAAIDKAESNDKKVLDADLRKACGI